MRTVYIADDGKEFDNEYDCKEYEHELQTKNNHIIIFNEEGNLLDSSNEENFEICYYIKVNNDKDLEILQKIYEYTGFTVPEKIGEFYYDNDTDSWNPIDNKIKNLEEELNKIKNIKEQLNGYQS